MRAQTRAVVLGKEKEREQRRRKYELLTGWTMGTQSIKNQ